MMTYNSATDRFEISPNITKLELIKAALQHRREAFKQKATAWVNCEKFCMNAFGRNYENAWDLRLAEDVLKTVSENLALPKEGTTEFKCMANIAAQVFGVVFVEISE